MGVFSLWSRVRTGKIKLIFADLVQIAKNRPGGLKVLVDFRSWLHLMSREFWPHLYAIYSNDLLIFDGGEYDLVHSSIISFVEALKSVNIELEFFIDGFYEFDLKTATLAERHLVLEDGLAEVIQFLHGEIPRSKIKTLPASCLRECQIKSTLQETGCTVHQITSGEADDVLARALRDDERAFCVLSNDTDFCIFPGCVFMPQDSFDLEDDCSPVGKSIIFRKPEKLICGIIIPKLVIEYFRLRDQDDLIELAIMAGNDFTRPILESTQNFCSIYKGKMEKISKLILQHGKAENCPFYGSLISGDPEMREAVEHSRKFYNLTLENKELNETNEVHNLLADGIWQGKYPLKTLTMHRGIYQHHTILEEPIKGRPSAETVWSALRRFVYEIVAPNDHHTVTELGRIQEDPFGVMEVHVRRSDAIIEIKQIQKNSRAQNLAVFEKIIMHKEIKRKDFFDGKSLFKVLGVRKGFLVYLLRYFLIFNMEDNLYLSRHEVFVLVVWVLAKHDHDKYRRFNIVPSARCVTIGNWFQDLYYTAVSYLGALLEVSQEFPTPREIFSGATWVALYTASAMNDPNPAHREPRPLSVDIKDMKDTYIQICDLVKAHKETIKHLARGLFPAIL